MTGKLVLFFCSVLVPLGLLLINRFINKSQLEQKDREINSLKRDVKNLTTQAENAQRAQSTQQKVNQAIGQFVKITLGNSETFSDLSEQAKQVKTEQDAIELARKQVEANR